MSNIDLNKISGSDANGSTTESLVIREIFNTYGDTVSISQKAKTLGKFGQNRDMSVNTKEMIWEEGGIEVLPSGNTIDYVVSTDASDTQEVKIETHTVLGGNYTFLVQTVTLNGLTPVALPTPCARASRVYNNGSVDFLGDVTVYDNTSGDVHCKASGTNGSNQSLKCATTISSQDYWIVEGIIASVKRGNNAKVDFEFQMSTGGKVWRTIALPFTVVSGDTVSIVSPNTPIIIPPNSDVRVVGTSDTNTTVASAQLIGQLAIII